MSSTATSPKSTVEGIIVSCPLSSELFPCPASVSRVGELDALPEREILPLTLPTIEGENVTRKVADCPPSSTRGTGRPLNWKSLPVVSTWSTVALPESEFVSVTSCVAFAPTRITPKSTVEGETFTLPPDSSAVNARKGLCPVGTPPAQEATRMEINAPRAARFPGSRIPPKENFLFIRFLKFISTARGTALEKSVMYGNGRM